MLFVNCAERILLLDYIIIGSDSGRITIIEYVPSQNRFNRIHLETFGKSGVRRVFLVSTLRSIQKVELV